ncbi:hypothetical protein FJY68_08000 [candidate division WOR-3 bacterium]|uniref:Lipoprotein n=1 Tax=candidate division WOR-3 bacterium TaxID=2052148 RepID=A0A937XHK9_UNCW3|nr:hypothetical protein [candidate division WOR-3 bacterium]
MRKPVLLVSALLLLISCSTLYVKAPPGQTVTLLANEPATVRFELRQVSLFWGLVPISNGALNTATWARQVNLSQMRVKSYYKWYEFLWNLPGFFLLGLHTNTVLIEGNPPALER